MHIIKKQVLDLKLQNKENAYQIQDQVSAIYNNRISRVLDEVCSRFSEPDRVFRLNSLEIDLGTLSLMHLEEEFAEKVRVQFCEGLARERSQLGLRQTPARFPAEPGSLPTTSEGENVFLSQEQRKLDLLSHFLKTATLPWWVATETIDSLERVCWQLLKTSPSEIRQFFEQTVLHKKIRHRAIYQFSDRLLFKILEMRAPEKTKELRNWLYDLNKIFTQKRVKLIPREEFRLVVWDVFFTACIKRELTELQILRSVLNTIAKKQDWNYKRVALLFSQTVEHLKKSKFSFQTSIPQVISVLKDELKEEIPIKIKQTPLSKSKKSKRSGSLDFQPEIIHDQETVEQVSKKLTDDEQQFEDEEVDFEAYVENSGLVILWPYLGLFFEELGYLKGETFANETLQARAILMLQYLATGKKESPEYDLLLNKLLCGWEIDKPLGKKIKLRSREKSESKKLLTTVISHWAALKSTSVAGFQSSFLQRNGLLLKKNNNWLLQVEPQAFDILFEQMPWSISLIKLSWMKTLLNVEW